MSPRRSTLLRACAGALALAAGGACTLLVGDLTECAVDGDCEGGLVCQEGFCVRDPGGGAGGGGDGGGPEAAGCTRLGLAPADAQPVDVGLLVFLTGTDGTPEANGPVTLHAAQLALEELNLREGTGARPFDAWACDTHGDPDTARAQAEALAAAGVPAIVGPDSSREMLAVAARTTPAGVLVISPSATSPEITFLPDKQDPGHVAGLVWRTAPSDALQGAVVAQLLSADPSVQRVAGIVVDDPYGDGLWNVFAGGYAGQSQRALYRRGESIDQAIAAAEAFDPDLIFVVAFPEDAVRIVDAAAQETNLSQAQLFFSDSAKGTDLFLVQDPSRLEGARGTAPASPRGAEFQSFLDRYDARFDEDPTQFAFIEHAYDAAYLVGLGAAWAHGPTGEGDLTGPRIAEGLTKLSSGDPAVLRPDEIIRIRSVLHGGGTVDVTGASGTLDFDPATGEAPSPIEEWRVVGGAFQTVTFHDPS